MQTWKKRFATISALATLLFSPNLFAGFSTYSNNWPPDLPPEAEMEIIEVPEPPPAVSDNAPIKVANFNPTDHLYLKFGGNINTGQVRQVKNDSMPPLSSLLPINKTAKENYASWEIGAGTKINSVRLELEYIYTKKVHYDQAPLFYNASVNLTSEVSNKAVLLNLFWDFDNFKIYYFSPYVGVLGGLAWNIARSAMYNSIGNGEYRDNNNYGLAWGFTFGARLPFGQRWAGYLGYRYNNLGKVKWRDNSTIMRLHGKYILSGFNLGVNFII